MRRQAVRRESSSRSWLRGRSQGIDEAEMGGQPAVEGYRTVDPEAGMSTPKKEISVGRSWMQTGDQLPRPRWPGRLRVTAPATRACTPHIQCQGTCGRQPGGLLARTPLSQRPRRARRSEEHTSELQSRVDLVCRLLLEKQ